MSRRTIPRSFWLWTTLGVVIWVYVVGSADWAGWLVLYASFMVLALDSRLGQTTGALATAWLTLALHHGVALVNAFLFTIPGAEMDATTFHKYGVEKIYEGDGVNLAIGSEFYENFLGFFYLIGGDSLLLGQELSVLAFALSCLFFVRFLDHFDIRHGRVWLLAAFGMLPSALLFGSITLREPFQLLLFMIGVYGGLRFVMSSGWGSLIACVGAFLAMGFFHQLLLLYALFAIMIVLLSRLLWGGASRMQGILATGAVAAAVVLGVFTMQVVKTNPGDDYVKMVRKAPVQALVDYRQSTSRTQPRTAFDVELDGSSTTGFLFTGAAVYVHYLFAPFPWKVEYWKDMYASAESLLRLVLILAALAVVFHANGARRRSLAILFLMYASMTLLWAMGTTNHGQAIRHHMVTNWILLVAGGPTLLGWLYDMGRVTGNATSHFIGMRWRKKISE